MADKIEMQRAAGQIPDPTAMREEVQQQINGGLVKWVMY